METEKPPRIGRGGFPLVESLLADPEGFQRRLIDRGGRLETLGALICGQRFLGQWTDQAVHFSTIITLLLQDALHVGHHLVERSGAAADIDGPVVRVIGRRVIVTPGGIPIPAVPVVPPAADQDDVTMI